MNDVASDTVSTWPEPSALGFEVVKQRADKGEGEAQFSLGCSLVYVADDGAGFMGASGRSPMADVGFEGWHFPTTCRSPYRGASMRLPDQMIRCGC